jgi:hypothetical protein
MAMGGSKVKTMVSRWEFLEPHCSPLLSSPASDVFITRHTIHFLSYKFNTFLSPFLFFLSLEPHYSLSVACHRHRSYT